MIVTRINEKTMKRLETYVKENNIDVNEFLNNLLDDEEKFNDPDYIEFCRRTEEAWKQVDAGEVIDITDKLG